MFYALTDADAAADAEELEDEDEVDTAPRWFRSSSASSLSMYRFKGGISTSTCNLSLLYYEFEYDDIMSQLELLENVG